MSSIQELIDHIRLGITHTHDEPIGWFCKSAILTAKNDQASHINGVLLRLFDDKEMIYGSVDTVCNKDDAVNCPVEIINSLKPAGQPYYALLSYHIATYYNIIGLS